ncbi:hypothetical protein [Xanthomarina sp. F2636L]|uniref:hypothetical protein n=1 Tax=Xanthomarina sp. F2636L TaxID=2996018 RepID=UPI00225E0CCB|nr:hypothetical protein [Xanthomarina sp. F2636L]MCX7551579.1 hypothetical protein [Xanthomarina sp. F2636L]
MTNSILKITIFILFILSVGSILAGYFLEADNSEKLIGLGVVGLFIFVFPLFSYYRWKDRNLKDYMINKENLDKMREYREKKNS